MTAPEPGLTAGELIILGSRLTKIGVAAMRGPHGDQSPAMPPGLSMVGADVLAHPATSISEIAKRTGLRQSYVSESVARLRDQGMVQTGPDPRDGRRTLVRLAAGHKDRVASHAAAPVDAALAEALGETDPAALAEIIAALTGLTRRLKPRQPGGVSGYLTHDLTRPE